MHPLHEYIAKQVLEHIRNRGVLVWYDTRKEFASFIGELRPESQTGSVVDVVVAGTPVRLAEYPGSMYQLRMMVEPFVSNDEPQDLIIYLPGLERDHQGSILMELEKGGDCYEPQLKRLARNVLRQTYTDGVIDELLSPGVISYEDLARASDANGSESPSLLKTIFHDMPGSEAILAVWLVDNGRDDEIEAKQARSELAKLFKSRVGLDLPEDASLMKLRALASRYVLGSEFRTDLRCPPPASLDSLPAPKTKDDESAVRALARRIRMSYPNEYESLSDRVQTDLKLEQAGISGELLGSIDTFRFEERVLLAYCAQLECDRRFEDALRIVKERQESYWLSRDVSRKAQWEAYHFMAQVGILSAEVEKDAIAAGEDPKMWVDSYTKKAGWYRLDQAQRRMESWIANLEEEPDERALGIVRRIYEDTCQKLAQGFSKALQKSGWTVSGAFHQTKTFPEVVETRPKPVAYFMVDAMRYEMGQELLDRLPASSEVSIRGAIGSFPSITPVGMAALLPGASASFSVVSRKEKLGVLIQDDFLPDLISRRKFAAARIPGMVDMPLDELLSLQRSKLEKKVKSCSVLVVRSQEIDHAGEAGFTFQAHQVMDTVIDNLARAIRKLSGVGIEQSVISADHGHLSFPADRDESMRIDPPGGQTVELHRRCWIGRGGMTPAGCVRVSATALGYDSDLDFVFPAGAGVFRAGGDLAYHHGGISLQEMIVPVLTVRLKPKEVKKQIPQQIIPGDIPIAVTNRIFSITLQYGNLSLFSGSTSIRPFLSYSGKQVGAAGMVIGAELDRETGCVKMDPAKPATIAFILNEDVPSVRIVIQDPETDAELYRSDSEIPVRLGV